MANRSSSFPVVSPSGLLDFEGCPKRWHETKVLKKYKFQVTEAITHGNVVHEQLEKYVKYSTPLPEHLENVVPVIDGLREQGFELYAELEMAITADWKPTGYWDKDCWLRGKIDLIALNADAGVAIVLDWKTGKRKPDTTQLKMYGAVLYHVLGLATVHSGYVWLKTDEHDTFTIDGGNIAIIQAEITERIGKMKEAYDSKQFPARTSPLCGWCPCLDDCEEAIYYKVKRDRARR